MRSNALWVLEDRRLGGKLSAELVGLGHQPHVVHEPAALLRSLTAQLPRVAVLELSHARRDRKWLIQTLARRFPDVRVLAVAAGAGRPVARALEMLGADVVHTGTGTRPLAASLSRCRRRARRRRRREPAMHAAVELGGLTLRERQVLSELGLGADNLTIGAVLGISERTVKVHVTSLFKKLGAANRVELALAARALA